MRNGRITQLILSILIFMSAGELRASEVIEVNEKTSRHYLTLNTNVNEITLQNLVIGETYLIFLHSENNNCFPYFTEDDLSSEFVFEFKANFVQKSISIFNPCNSLTPVRLSIGCTSCHSYLSNRNLMGIMTDENYSAQELIQDVFIGGDCFDVDQQSISFIGNDLARGVFTNGSSSINIEEGVILATGDIHNSAGPNDDYNTGNSFFDFGTDPDLAQMINSDFLFDMAALEFDFTPTTDQISFDFVFASEEYCEYVNSSFNDVFGFFISGPGINGPFTNGAESIAIVPNTNDYTAINTVNHLSNSAYYVNNIPTTQHSEMPSYLECAGYPTTENGVAVNDIQYDGFTTAMTAVANVQACETYHIKLIIADVADAYFDSAVFLKANSFNAGEAATASTQAPGGGANSNIAFEDCLEGGFVFERATDDLTEPLVINFTVSPISTATPGVDYEPLPTAITIPAGDSTFYLPLNVYNDALLEGSETVILDFDAPCSCSLPYVILFIEDLEPLAVVSEDVYFCDPVPLTIEPLVLGGMGNYTYSWNTGDTTATLPIFADANAVYSVTVTDECGNSAETITTISIIETPTAMISGYELLCPSNPNGELIIEFTGSGPWDLIYTIDNVQQAPITGITNNPFILQTSILGTYQLESVNTSDCFGAVQGAGTVTTANLVIDVATGDESCPGASDGLINTIPSGGAAPYVYIWDNNIGNVANPDNLSAGIYNLTLTDENGCSTSTQIEVALDPEVPDANAGSDETLDCNNATATLNGTGSVGVNYVYMWTTPDGNIISGANTLNPVVDEAGTYNLNISNINTGCMVIDKTEVFIDTISPQAVIEAIGPLTLTCSNPSTVLDGSGSSPFNELSFEWMTSDGNILSGANTATPEVGALGTYWLIVTNMNNGCTNTSSFFVDADLELPEINIQPAELLTCLDSMITLQAGGSSSGTNYTTLWTTDDGNFITGSNTLIPTVDQPGTYTLTIFNTSNDCQNTASVQVAEDRIPPIADAGLTTELGCNDDAVSLDGSGSSSGADFYFQWETNNGAIQNGWNDLYPEVSMAGNYALIVTNIRNGCTASDEVLVIEDPDVPNALTAEIVDPECFGDFGAIAITSVSGGEAPYVYSINNGTSFFSEGFFQNLPPGNYEVTIQDAEGCLYTEQLTIQSVPEVLVDVEPEVEISLGETYQIEANVNIPLFQLDSILWSPSQTLDCNNCLDPVAFPLQTTTYEIIVTDQNGCPALAEITVRVDKDRKIFIPNAFSPNGDGSNDRFMIYAKEGLVTRISKFQIFNRWGGKVFDVRDAVPNDPLFGWDGVMKGEVVNNAVFIYFAEIEFIDGEKIIYKGDFTVTN